VAHRSPRLLHARRGKGGKTDDITRGVDIFDVRLEMLVHGNDPALAGFHSHLLESKLSRIALSSRRDRHRIAGQCRTGGEFEPNATGFQRTRLDLCLHWCSLLLAASDDFPVTPPT
jgi:hypothetical protein